MTSWSLIAAWRAFAREWQAFFHAPGDGRVLAVLRIVYATLVLVHLAVLYPDLALWFTADGVLPGGQAAEITSQYAWSVFRLLPDTAAAVQVCFWIIVLNTVLLLVGCLPRVNAALLFVWLVSLQNRNPIILDGEDTLMRMMAFFLIWMPSGACWSLNAVVRRWWRSHRTDELASGSARRGVSAGSAAPAKPAGPEEPTVPPAPGWALRLWQIEMALMFLSTALAKWSGQSWLNGTALYYVSRLDEYFGRLPVPAWAFDTPWIVAAITWSVLLVETAVPFLIWFRETRLWCLAAVLIFHLANEWSMNLFLFHWLMICGWLAFLSPDDFAWIARRRKH